MLKFLGKADTDARTETNPLVVRGEPVLKQEMTALPIFTHMGSAVLVTSDEFLSSRSLEHACCVHETISRIVGRRIRPVQSYDVVEERRFDGNSY